MTISESLGSSFAGSLGDKVYEQLEADILSNKYKLGEPLVESKISAELGVSRTPVREAIRMLEQHGLVEIVPNKGAVVLGINEKELMDIYTIRMYIEGLAARWTADKVTQAMLTDLTEMVDLQEFYQMKNAISKINDLDTRFHERIYHYSGSRPLQHTLTDLHHMISWFRGLSFGSEGRAAKAIEEHRQILKAIQIGDGDLAEKLMVQHIENARESILRIMKKNA